jgi:glycerophosphoryl diester phosphodiesterase
MSLDAAFLIIGHRGAAGLEPENTLRSFARAIALDVDAIELDVYRVEDALLVIHDDTLERTTNGRGKVMESSFAALRALDAGAGECIPTLDEVLDLVAGRVAVNIELKGEATAAPAAHVIGAYPSTEFLVSSFAHLELTQFRALDATTPVAPLFHRTSAKMFEIADALQAWSINLSAKIATVELLQEIGAAGFRSLVYTVNDYAQAEALQRAGAAGVFTDYPDRMAQLKQ